MKIKVINDAGYPDLVHWHGLYLPALQDGATEEGSPIIPVGESFGAIRLAKAMSCWTAFPANSDTSVGIRTLVYFSP